jgi:hypothetical protein
MVVALLLAGLMQLLVPLAGVVTPGGPMVTGLVSVFNHE